MKSRTLVFVSFFLKLSIPCSPHGISHFFGHYYHLQNSFRCLPPTLNLTVAKKKEKKKSINFSPPLFFPKISIFNPYPILFLYLFHFKNRCFIIFLIVAATVSILQFVMPVFFFFVFRLTFLVYEFSHLFGGDRRVYDYTHVLAVL